MVNLPTSPSPGAQLFRSLVDDARANREPVHAHILEGLLVWPGEWTQGVVDWTVRCFDLALPSIARQPEASALEAKLVERLQRGFLWAFSEVRAAAQLERAGIPVRWGIGVHDQLELFAPGRLGEVCFDSASVALSESADLAALLFTDTWQGLSPRARSALRGATLLFDVGDRTWSGPSGRFEILEDPETRRRLLAPLLAALEGVALDGGPDRTLFSGPSGLEVAEGLRLPPHGAMIDIYDRTRRAPLAVSVQRTGSSAPARLLATNLLAWCRWVGPHDYTPKLPTIGLLDVTWADSLAAGVVQGSRQPGDAVALAVSVNAFPVEAPPAAGPRALAEPSWAFAPAVLPGAYGVAELPMDILRALAEPLPLEPGAPAPRRTFRVPPSRPAPAVDRRPYAAGAFRDAVPADPKAPSLRVRSPADWSDDLGEWPLGEPMLTDGERLAARAWAEVPVTERFAALRRLRERLSARRADFVDAICRSLASPSWEARWEADMLPATIDAALPQIERALSDPPSLPAHREWCLHPRGALALDPPSFHGALWLNAHAVSALALGHAVRARSPSSAPWVGSLYALCVHEAGFPAGAFSLAHVKPSDWKLDAAIDEGAASVGPAAPKVAAGRLATFWDPTGWCPAFVLDDADVDGTARGLVEGALVSMGQRATSTTHCLVEGPELRRRLEARVIEWTRALATGHFEDAGVFCGPPLGPPRLAPHLDDYDVMLGPTEPPVRVDGRVGLHETPAVLSFRGGPSLDGAPRGGSVNLYRLDGGDDALVRLAHARPVRAVAIFTRDQARFERLAARLDVPAVLWNLPTTRVGERMPRFPILPWAPHGPHHHREILRAGSEPKSAWPRPQMPRIG